MQEHQNKILQNQDVNQHLFWQAACDGDMQSLRYYIKNMLVNIDFVEQQVTPLLAAVYNGHVEVVAELIRHGANVYFKTPSGQSILWTAAQKGYTDIVSLLLEQGAYINEASHFVTPLWIAVQENHLDTVKALIKDKECDINSPHQLEGITPLFKAISSDHMQMIDVLLEAHVDIDLATNTSHNPLHLACSKNNFSLVRRLVEAGANVNAIDLNGYTPLSYVNRQKHSDIANYLLQNGALPDNIGQVSINNKLIKYLALYPIIHQKKYNAKILNDIKNQLKRGLCYGYTKIHRLNKDFDLDNQFKKQIILVSNWDNSFAALKENSDLEEALHFLLFNAFVLQKLEPANITDCVSGIKNEDAQLQILLDSYEQVFQCGFVFKYDELEKLLSMILIKGITIDLKVILPNNAPHIISLTLNDNGKYELFDSNASVIESIKSNSLASAIDLLKLLLGANNNCIGLGISIELNSPSAEQKVKYQKIKDNFFNSLIDSRVSTNELDLKDNHQLTSIFYALFDIDIDLAKKLITNNPDVCSDKTHFPLIHLATQLNQYELVNELLVKGSDINSTYDNVTSLYLASSTGLLELVNLLLKQNAIIDWIAKGQTPLYEACREGYYEIAKALLLKGANVNYQTDEGYTPLLVAIVCGHSALVELLIKHGADVHFKLYSSSTMGLAIVEGFLDIVKILIAAGVSLLDVGDDKTAIELAKSSGKTHIVEYLAALDKQQTIHVDLRETNKYRLANNSLFFAANTKAGQTLIKGRHASADAQKAYDEHYGLICLSK